MTDREEDIEKLAHMFGRNALVVKGLGRQQIADMLETGIADKTPASFFTMASRPVEETADAYDELMGMDGWKPERWENLLAAIETARDTALWKLLSGLNISCLSGSLSKKLEVFWKSDPAEFLKFIDLAASRPDAALAALTAIEGVGEGKALPLIEWAATVQSGTERRRNLEDLIGCLRFGRSLYLEHLKEQKEQQEKFLDEIAPLRGRVFVITGSVKHYKNRDYLKRAIEDVGGKVTGTVTRNTSYLIDNSKNVPTEKNRRARELGVPIISEDELIDLAGHRIMRQY